MRSQPQILNQTTPIPSSGLEGIQELTDDELATVNGGAPVFLIFRLLMLFSTAAH